MEVNIEIIPFEEVKALKNEFNKEGLTLVNSKGSVWLGAKINETLVGVCSYRKNSYGVLYKSDLVLEAYRNQGIYRKLFEMRMKHIKKLNPRKIYAYCTNASLHFFKKNGFLEKRNYKKKYTHVELKYPFRNTKIDFEAFCKIIDGTVVYGPREMKIYGFSKTIKGVNSSGTVVFFKGTNAKKLNQSRLLRFSHSTIVFQPGAKIDKFLPNITYIIVKNIEESYWRFVEFYRSQFDIPVFAITGTCGKTTVKEMVSQILKSKYNVVSTIKNYNSPFRNIQYLGRITEDTDIAVFETPASDLNFLNYTCRYFKPTIGMITNIGTDHLKSCGTVENYIRAKGKMIEGLGYNGTLILNADDENTKKIPLDKFEGKIIYISIKSPTDYYASDIKYVKNGMEFVLHHQHLSYKVFVPGYGEHQVYNALGAICSVHQVGFDINEAIKQLKSFKNIKSHVNVSTGYNGATVIDDTWNSNPTSIEASLKVLQEISSDKEKIAVIGSIAWLGNQSAAIHRELGNMIAKHEINQLILYGDFAKQIAAGAKENGFAGEIFICNTSAKLKTILLPLLNDNKVLLMKNSMKDKTLRPLLGLLNKKS